MLGLGGVLQQALYKQQVGVYNHGRAGVGAEVLVDVHVNSVTKKLMITRE